MADKVRTFPELSGNFVPLPADLIDLLLTSNLTREELLVTLFMGRATYGFGLDRTFIGPEQVARGTGLKLQAAEEALARAIERGTLLPFSTEGSGRFYLLNTDQNRRVANVLDEQGPTAEITPPPVLAAESTPMPRGLESTPPTGFTAASAPQAQSLRGVPRKVLERIVSIIGRDLTRDETERLADLKATGELLMKAIDGLVAKHVEIYSSDQVIYEYESIVSAQKRKADEVGRRERAEVAKQRTRTCRKCNGLGYMFIGVNTIKECDCRKVE